MPVPTRSTSEQQLDQWNIAMRASPIYQQFLTSIGQNTPGVPARLTDRQQEQLEQLLAANGMRVPGGMHIDQGGNLNQKNRTARNIAIGAGIAGATLATMGAAGAFSGAAAGAGGAAGGAGAGAAGAAGGITAAGGATAGMGAGLGASGAFSGAGALGAAGAGAGALGGITATGGGSAGLGAGASAAGTFSGAGAAGGAAAGGSSILSRLGGWGGVAQTGLGLAGDIAGSMGQNRSNENDFAADQARNANQQYSIQQQAALQALMGESGEQSNHAGIDLQRRQFSLDAPSTRGRQALLGSLMQNMQPARLTGLSPQISSRMPQITGGLSPSAIGPLARQMGLLMQQNAVSGQQRGDQFAPLTRTNFQGGLLPPPNAPTYRGPGAGETILGLLGSAGRTGQQPLLPGRR